MSSFLGTSVTLAGPPVVLLFAARDLPKRVFRGTNAVYFMTLSLVALGILFIRGVAEAGDLSWRRSCSQRRSQERHLARRS